MITQNAFSNLFTPILRKEFNKAYSAGFSISSEMLEDDMYSFESNQINNMPRLNDEQDELRAGIEDTTVIIIRQKLMFEAISDINTSKNSFWDSLTTNQKKLAKDYIKKMFDL